MNNCYCGHPKESHKGEDLPGQFIYKCWHCVCEKYIESQDPKALEEKGCPCGNEDRYHMEKRIFEGGFNAKLQDEPKECCEKCRQYLNKNMNRYECNRYFTCPCHQKDTEPKEMVGGSLLKKDYIILPRPKGKSIDRTFHEFQLFWEDRHADYVDDDKFLNEWNQFIKSQE